MSMRTDLSARLPYRSFRHLLSLHASATPDAPFFAAVGPDNRQISRTFAVFNGCVHQIAGYLFDDVGLRPGDPLRLAERDTTEAVLLLCAGWLIGAVVDLRAENVDPAPRVDLSALTDKPNTLIALPSAAAPPLEAPALIDVDGTTFSYRDLLLRAGALVSAQAITGRQRLLLGRPFHRPADIVFGLLAPLIAGGMVLWCPILPAMRIWRTLARADSHIAYLDGAQIAALSAVSGDDLSQEDHSRWGRGVERRDLRRLRHISVDASTLTADAVSAFEARFGIRLLNAYHAPGTPGWTASLPIDLTWDEHRRWQRDGSAVGVGCALYPDDDLHLARAPHLRSLTVDGQRCYFLTPPSER